MADLQEPSPDGEVGGGTGSLRRVDFAELAQLNEDAAIVASCMQKGGVGKTETTKGVGDQLALATTDGTSAGERLRVLYVDMDPNGTLSDGVGVTDDGTDGLASLMLGKEGSVLDLVYAVTPYLHIIPTRDDMFSLNDDLAGKRGRERRLWRVLQPLLRYYHVILLDCESNLGTGTDNCLYAVARRGRGGVVIVVQLEGPSMRNFEILLDQIEALEAELEVVVPLLGWFANFTSNSKVHKRYRSHFESLPLNKLGEMPARTKIKEAWDEDALLSDYASASYDANFIYKELAAKVWGAVRNG